MKRIHTTHIAHNFIKNYVKKGDLVIDATMGKGNDTKFLCKLVGNTGKVISLDIQKQALEITKDLLQKEDLLHISDLVLDNHKNIDKYAKKETISCITFNFGYLPGGDHSISTKPKTSVIAIKKGLDLLKINGVISLCIYQGGDTGFEEKEHILNLVKTIDCHKYTVIYTDFINRINHPPIFVGIIRDR